MIGICKIQNFRASIEKKELVDLISLENNGSLKF